MLLQRIAINKAKSHKKAAENGSPKREFAKIPSQNSQGSSENSSRGGNESQRRARIPQGISEASHFKFLVVST
jgi:hypothetical protein